jgi:hypothetical protein
VFNATLELLSVMVPGGEKEGRERRRWSLATTAQRDYGALQLILNSPSHEFSMARRSTHNSLNSELLPTHEYALTRASPCRPHSDPYMISAAPIPP